MATDHVVLTLTLLLTAVCSGHVINKRREPTQMLRKMEEITNHLNDLTKSMAEFDADLRQALDVTSQRARAQKRETTGEGTGCTGLRQDICLTQEILAQKVQSGELGDEYYPGKRSGLQGSEAKYSKMLDDLRKRRELLSGLRGVFDKAGHILDREKRWFTCNLNLGFTCQTQEYSAIADYYDFLNSADSPGKRSLSSPHS